MRGALSITQIKDNKAIILLNKSDLDTPDTRDLTAEISEKTGKSNIPVIRISAKTGEGMGLLEQCIYDMFFSEMIDSDDSIYISNLRHRELLVRAAKSLENVRSSVDQGLSEDFYTIDLTDAYTALGLITGEHVEDELADRIFSDFCMGK